MKPTRPATPLVVLLALVTGACATTAPPTTTTTAPTPAPVLVATTVTTTPPAPTPAAVSASTPAPPAPTPPAERVGFDEEHPVKRCGPQDSYYYVATVFHCDDGSNPFHGDVEAGRQARLRNVGANRSGHIIDLYEVPCPEGPRSIYVDMYGCTEH
jgi:hypothetical protein